GLYWRMLAKRRPCYQCYPDTLVVHAWNLRSVVMRERRFHFFLVFWQGNPGLNAREYSPIVACCVRCALRMGNARAGGHPVDFAGTYCHVKAQAVLVLD